MSAPSLLVAIVVLVLAAGAVVGLDATGHVPGALFDDPPADADRHPVAEPVAPGRRPGARLRPPGRPARPADLAERLLADPDLGGDVGAYVVDVATGEVLLDRDAASARTPASVAKLATAAGALVALGPDHPARDAHGRRRAARRRGARRAAATPRSPCGRAEAGLPEAGDA